MYQISKYSNKIKNTLSNVIFNNDETEVQYPFFLAWQSQGQEGNSPVFVECFPEELNEYTLDKTKESVFLFLNNNKAEGKRFFDDMHVRITMHLSAIDRNILFPILEEIDNLLYPPLNKIKTGDFASALWIFCGQNDPSNSFVLDLYDEAFSFCQEYYNTKYPK